MILYFIRMLVMSTAVCLWLNYTAIYLSIYLSLYQHAWVCDKVFGSVLDLGFFALTDSVVFSSRVIFVMHSLRINIIAPPSDSFDCEESAHINALTYLLESYYQSEIIAENFHSAISPVNCHHYFQLQRQWLWTHQASAQSDDCQPRFYCCK